MKKTSLIAALFTLCLLTLPKSSSTIVKNAEEEQYIRGRVVQLEGNYHACTGVQITSPSGRSFILTAAHCDVLRDAQGYIQVSTDTSTRPIPRKVLEVSPNSDLMLIEGLQDLRGIDVAEVAPEHKQYSAFTHGERLPTHRANGEYLGAMRVDIGISQIDTPEEHDKCESVPKQKDQGGMCVLSVTEEVSTISVEPGSSGGPIVNSGMELVGIVSASDSHFSFMVTLKDIHEFLKPY